MKEYTVLTINPGSSSTKMGLVKGGKVIIDNEVDHNVKDFEGCKNLADQEPIRTEMILSALKEHGVELSELDANIRTRCGSISMCWRNLRNRVILVYEHAKSDIAGINHPATLGIVISYKLGKKAFCSCFFCKSNAYR